MTAFINNLVFILIAVVVLYFGIMLLSRPRAMIKMQQNFYALINWRMEPISMPIEIRNTKIMGLFLIVFDLAAIIYFLLH